MEIEIRRRRESFHMWRWFSKLQAAEQVCAIYERMTGDEFIVEKHGYCHFVLYRVTPEGKTVEA